jgi:hypothetical protein
MTCVSGTYLAYEDDAPARPDVTPPQAGRTMLLGREKR